MGNGASSGVCGGGDRIALYARALAEYFAPAVAVPVHLFPAKDDTQRDALGCARAGPPASRDARSRRHLAMLQEQNVTALGAAVAMAIT